MMTRYLWIYLATALVFFPIDMLWLRLIARGFYESRLGDLLTPEPKLGVAAGFYLLYCAGVVFFAILPNLSTQNVVGALLSGALLGLIAYGTYDATNLATLRGYPASLAIVDLLWGTFLTAIAAAGGLLIATRVFGVQS